MDIITVKLLENGYLLNDSMTVPNSPGNSHYQSIQKWIADGNTPDPMYTLEETKANKLADLDKQYNDDTVRTIVYNTKNIIVNESSSNGVVNKINLVTNDTNVSDINWYFDDGKVSTLTLANLKTLQKKIANKDQLLRDIKYEHTQAIQAFTEDAIALLDAYDVTTDINSLSWSA